MKLFSRLNQYGDWGLLILRVGIAVIFVAHGVLKFGTWHMQPSETLPAGMLVILKILSIAEPLGALSMIAGFLTPLAAIGMSVLMIGVINMKINMMHVGFIEMQGKGTGWEFDFIILCVTLCILITGPGKISLEHFLRKK